MSDIYIKPSHRGRLTELKARTGKTEAELYNDGNPAHKKMVVFARNARKWNRADGGDITREDPPYSVRAKIGNLDNASPRYIIESFLDHPLTTIQLIRERNARRNALQSSPFGGGTFSGAGAGGYWVETTLPDALERMEDEKMKDKIIYSPGPAVETSSRKTFGQIYREHKAAGDKDFWLDGVHYLVKDDPSVKPGAVRYHNVKDYVPTVIREVEDDSGNVLLDSTKASFYSGQQFGKFNRADDPNELVNRLNGLPFYNGKNTKAYGGLLNNYNPEIYNGGILPSIVVKPKDSNFILTTYPISKKYPISHSSLDIFDSDTGKHMTSIDSQMSDPDYDLFLNNCSDATGHALETWTNKKITSPFISTPYGVRKRLEKYLEDKGDYMAYREDDGAYYIEASMPWYNARKIQDEENQKIFNRLAYRIKDKAKIEKLREQWNKDRPKLSYSINDGIVVKEKNSYLSGGNLFADGGSTADSILYDYFKDQGNPIGDVLLVQPQAPVRPAVSQAQPQPFFASPTPLLRRVPVEPLDLPSESEGAARVVLTTTPMEGRTYGDLLKAYLNTAAKDVPAAEYVPSENLIQAIMGYEGFLERPSRKIDGKWTIGYGDTDKALNDYYLKNPNKKYNKTEAEKRLRDRVTNEFLPELKKSVPNWERLTPQQKDSLLSYAYNVGKYFTSTHKNFVNAMKDFDIVRAAKELNAGWNQRDKSTGKLLYGLRKRRIREQRAFLGDKFSVGGVIDKLKKTYSGDAKSMLEAVRKARGETYEQM